MKRRNFKLTFSLKAGYGKGGKRFRLVTAEKTIMNWMLQRLQTGEPVVSGFLQEGKLFFPAKDTAHATVTVEPTAIFEGELSSPKDGKRSNKEVEITLESLARVLKDELKQKFVFISYRDRHWCV